MKIDHILLTTDLSPESLRPFGELVAFAAEQGARITLLHVVQEVPVVPHGAPLAPPPMPMDTEKDVAAARKALEEQRRDLPADVTVETKVVVSANVAEAVRKFASEGRVDLIALSTHGRTGWRHLVLGSVAEDILRHAEVPVLCFPRGKR